MATIKYFDTNLDQTGVRSLGQPVACLKKISVLLLSLFFAFEVVIYCDRSLATDQEVVFRRYLPQNITTLDPLVSVEIYSQSIIRQVYDTLFVNRDGNTPEPHLAKSFSFDPQTKIYRIQLRSDITFQNGKPLLADDVIFTFRRICKHPAGTVKMLKLIRGCRDQESFGVKKLSATEVAIELKESFPPFLATLATPQFMILPDGLSGKNEKAFFAKPIGTGAYILESHSEKKITLLSNKKYFLGQPKIGRLEYLVEPPERIYDLVSRGEIDDIYPLAPPKEFASNYEVVKVNTAITLFLAFRPQISPFNDENLRKALRASIDTSVFFEKFKKEPGLLQAGGVVPWGAIGYDDNLPTNYFKPELAKTLVASSSFQRVEKVPPIDLYFALKEPYETFLPNEIKQQLNKVGFKVNVISKTVPALLNDIAGGKEIGAMVIRLTVAAVDSYEFLELWRSDFHNTLLRANDKHFDRLLDSALQTTDRLSRAQIYQKANSFLSEHAYTLNFLYLTKAVSLRAKKWIFPKSDILGPYTVKMNEVDYAEGK